MCVTQPAVAMVSIKVESGQVQKHATLLLNLKDTPDICKAKTLPPLVAEAWPTSQRVGAC
jgi:hypothetical protein